jgi:hypothetical protein
MQCGSGLSSCRVIHAFSHVLIVLLDDVGIGLPSMRTDKESWNTINGGSPALVIS